LGAVGFASFNLTGTGCCRFSACPVAGRAFRDGEDAPGALPVVMISDALWRRRFGADPLIALRTE